MCRMVACETAHDANICDSLIPFVGEDIYILPVSLETPRFTVNSCGLDDDDNDDDTQQRQQPSPSAVITVSSINESSVIYCLVHVRTYNRALKCILPRLGEFHNRLSECRVRRTRISTYATPTATCTTRKATWSVYCATSTIT